ncbi:MAG: hypothetical protein BIFFINMI_00053 [Phycisphaerae bacterium]|nr:hypothetical protein [Phycisphaerae bacterium]
MDNRSDFERELTAAVRGQVRFDLVSRRLYATDASIYEIQPRGVVTPLDRADLEAACRTAFAHDVPLLVRGGGTSLAGQAVADALIVDTSRHCNRLLEVNVAEHWARVQPGLVLDNLNATLKPHGLWFPPDVATSAQATLGGMIGNNSAGAHSILYGMTTDHVLELTVMLADGSVHTIRPMGDGELERLCTNGHPLGNICRGLRQVLADNREEIERRFPKIQRRVSGYALDRLAATGDAFNLCKLLVGSEGTLAVVLEAKINLVPLARFKALTVAHFDTLADSVSWVEPILASKPAAVELTDRNLMDQTRHQPQYRRQSWWIQGNPAATLIIEYYGDTAEEAADKAAAIKRRLADAGVRGPWSDAITPQQQADVWAVRKAGLGLLMSKRGARKPIPFMEDCGVPVQHLPEYVRGWSEIAAREQTSVAFYAHASVGVLHIRPFLDLSTQEDIDRMHRIADAVTDMVTSFGGSVSGEHGDGRARSGWLRKMYGNQIVDAFGRVKALFDPRGLLNPGNIVDPPSMKDNLRLGAGFTLPVVQTGFDYTDQGGFGEAVTMCNGQGLCRKTLTGTMCPSYMVTLDEQHSTRGRANALREMLSGRVDVGSWDSDRLAEVFDLCLGCKGCLGECPSNVDVARLRAEFLYQRYKLTGGPPRGIRALGHVERANRLGSMFAPLSNWVMSVRLFRRLLGPPGLDSRRSMPPWRRNTLLRWWKKRAGSRSTRPSALSTQHSALPRRQVVLFPDCFVTYNEPEVGQATVAVLEAAGYEVIMGPSVCCGRALISQGMLDEARDTQGRLLDAYAPLLNAELPILGVEPSCITTFRDELLALHPNDERAKKLARHSFMIEEFLVAEADAGRLTLPLADATGPILLHGHCQAKALVGTAPTEKMLRLIPGAKVSVVDSGCCGMAGSFGYKKGHYEISMAIGERVLFPAVRQAVAESAASLVAAPGTSCRHQIHDGTGNHARHPVQILADHLKKPRA